jgi:hypothetical protein
MVVEMVVAQQDVVPYCNPWARLTSSIPRSQSNVLPGLSWLFPIARKNKFLE